MAPQPNTYRSQLNNTQASNSNSTTASQDASQDIDTAVMQGLMEQHKKNVCASFLKIGKLTYACSWYTPLQVKARRRVREAHIQQTHKQRFDELNHRIDAAVAVHERQLYAIEAWLATRLMAYWHIYSRATHLPQLQRLSDLVQRKQQLESTIEASLDDMEKMFETAAAHLAMGIRGRIGDMQG
jgi:hypothetical protein